jgi:hypothetical protein
MPKFMMVPRLQYKSLVVDRMGRDCFPSQLVVSALDKYTRTHEKRGSGPPSRGGKLSVATVLCVLQPVLFVEKALDRRTRKSVRDRTSSSHLPFHWKVHRLPKIGLPKYAVHRCVDRLGCEWPGGAGLNTLLGGDSAEFHGDLAQE